MPHYIRTPMNAIRGFTYIIEQNPDDREVVMDAVNKIQKSSDTLMNLLNNVLELSKIESGKDELDVHPVDLNEFLEKLQIMFAKEMVEAELRFLMESKIADSQIWMS